MQLIQRHQRTRLLAVFALAFALCVPTAAGAVTRTEVVQRGKVWVDKNVPYSQSGYAYTNGTVIPSGTSNASSIGWRRDCSGFVSMCLGITRSDGTPYSMDTAGLPYRLTKLTSKNDLLPGDIILRPKTSTVGGHAVVFVRWTDSTKTKYVGYHERGTAYGTVAQEITYPYWGSEGFAPYRYKAIENARLRKSLTWFGPLTARKSSLPTGGALPLLQPPSIGTTLQITPAP